MNPRKSPILHIALIVVLGLLVYSNTFEAPFQFDDRSNIIRNSFIKNISNIPSLFAGSGKPFASRVLMNATNALNYHFGGLDTTGYHVVNIALHLINGVLLYFLVLTTGRLLKYGDDGTRLVALLSSLVFVLHPVQTEAVTYVVSRSMLFATTFYLLGILLFAKAATTDRKRWPYIAGLFVSSLLGAASRENFITFPVILILYDLFFISGFRAKEALGRWRLYVPVLIACAYLVYLAMNNSYDVREQFTEISIPPVQYVLTQMNVHWTYLRLLVLPVNQTIDYGYPNAQRLLELPTALSSLGYLGLWAGGIFLARKKPALSFAVLWFVITLTPVSIGLTFTNLRLGDVIFEHRLYLPSVGILAGFSALTLHMAAGIKGQTVKTSLALGLVLLLVVLSVAAYKRNELWQSEKSLWGDVVKKSPANIRGYINLAAAYNNEGLPAEAIRHYQFAIDNRSPDVPSTYCAIIYKNLGDIYFEKGLLDKAIKYYEASIFTDPKYPSVYTVLGLVYMQKGLPDKAIEHYLTAIRVDPNFAPAYNNLGNAFFRKGLIEEAIENYEKAVSLDSRNAAAYNNLGLAYMRKGLLDKAIENLTSALRLGPDNRAQIHNNLGVAYMQRGFTDKAIEHFNAAIGINPRYANAHRNLGEAYTQKGLQGEARRHFGIADSLPKDNGGTGTGTK